MPTTGQYFFTKIIVVFSLLHFETRNNFPCLHLSILAFWLRGRGSVLLNRAPWLLPVPSAIPGDLTAEWFGNPERAGGHEDASLPIVFPDRVLAGASPSKALDMCEVCGQGFNTACFALQACFSWAKLLYWRTDNSCSHAERVARWAVQTETSVRESKTFKVWGSVLILCA